MSVNNNKSVSSSPSPIHNRNSGDYNDIDDIRPSSRNNYQRKINMTPQMLTLGRDGRDLEQSRGHHLLEEEEKKENNNINDKKKGWLKIFRGGSKSLKSNYNDDYNGGSSILVESLEKTRKTSSSPRNKLLLQSIQRSLSNDDVEDERGINHHIDGGELENQAFTEEDAVRQDCSFFYRDMDEDTYYYRHRRRQQVDGGAFSFLFSETNNNNNGGSSSVPNPRARAAFRARYQQLNGYDKDEDGNSDDDNNNNFFCDLWMDEEEDKKKNPDVMPILESQLSNITNSSLCWYQDGRILMRLPKDKVRLVMDSELEAGILAVVEDSAQQKQDDNTTKQGGGKATDDNMMYVLTVDENLYRRVIGEISDSFFAPFRINQFCIENGRVDISVAICLLSVILIILLVNTIIWPVD